MHGRERDSGVQSLLPRFLIIKIPDLWEIVCRVIVHEDVALRGVLVPLEHRVDGFRKLCAALFVNAAGVDPRPLLTTCLRQIATSHDLLPASPTAIELSGDEVLVSNFSFGLVPALTPAMGKYAVRHLLRVDELLECQGGSVEKSHIERRLPNSLGDEANDIETSEDRKSHMSRSEASLESRRTCEEEGTKQRVEWYKIS